jgi:hypothetical protein
MKQCENRTNRNNAKITVIGNNRNILITGNNTHIPVTGKVQKYQLQEIKNTSYRE